MQQVRLAWRYDASAIVNDTMVVSVVTHALHGGLAVPLSTALTGGSLLAAAGRVVAVAPLGSASVDLYDAHDVAELSAVLGPGSVRLRFLASFAVTDVVQPVTVHALAFLRGGLLAVTGVCARGAGAWRGGGGRAGRAADGWGAPALPH